MNINESSTINIIKDQDPLHRSLSSSNLSLETKQSINSFSNIGTIKTKLNVDDVPPNIEGLKILIKNGCWRSVMKLADRCISTTNFPHDILQFKLCRIISQVNMRMYKAALNELESLGNFDNKENCFENYPDLYPGLKGSMIPFSMRILKIELLYLLKLSNSLDPFYELLSICRKELEILTSTLNQENLKRTLPISLDSLTFISPCSYFNLFDDNNDIDLFPSINIQENAIEIWKLREERIIFLIINKFLELKEFPLALSLLSEIVSKNPNDPILLSAIGRIHLQMGNIRAASNIFKYIENFFSQTEISSLISMNRGFLAFSLNQYSTAMNHFQLVIDKGLYPSNIIAANNKAICLLYSCELTHAITLLENLIKQNPELNLREPIVFNLCTLYDLKSENSQEKKKYILNLVTKFASDSFDFSVLKLNIQ
jgi:tetratricopeptide (TPR) repeat protein